MATFTLASTVARYPRLPYEKMKNDVLGASYSLSLVFVGAQRAQRLNREHRGKEYVPDVLSFPLDEHHGEIYITPKAATRGARTHGMTLRAHIGFLFIHGMLHLKGMRHGAKMEDAERAYLKRYRLS